MGLRQVVITGGICMGLGLAGCGAGGEGGATDAGASVPTSTSKAAEPAPSSAATRVPRPRSSTGAGDARAALTAAARTLGDDSLRFRSTMGRMATATGVADPATRAVQIRWEQRGPKPLSMEVRHTGRDMYLRIDQQAGGQWLHIPGNRVPADMRFGSAQDPGDSQRLLRAVTGVRWDGPRGFRGTLDATKSPSSDPAALKLLGAKARKVPFSARVDAQGRLVGLTLHMDAVHPMIPALVTRYYDFGTRVVVSKPRGPVLEASQDMLDALNGSAAA